MVRFLALLIHRMGLLSTGTPLAWEEAAKYAEKVRREGIEQLINIYNRVKGRTLDNLRWGDELEYVMVECGEDPLTGAKRCFLSIRAEQVLEGLRAEMKERIDRMPDGMCPLMMSADGFTATWHPEYGRYMLEGTPARPYLVDTKDLVCVERDMIARRRQAEMLLRPGECILAMGNYPRLGCADAFADPRLLSSQKYLTNEATHSLCFPDEFINTHPRFKTLTRNIRIRRGEKISINLPLFKDVETTSIDPLKDALFPESLAETAELRPDAIHLDAMGFGMGCCCLQITFQARDILEARLLYDQLAVICPIMLALTASTPIFRGYLSEVDARWDVISASVDDRSAAERGMTDKDLTAKRIPKSRYSSISRFIAIDDRLQPHHNDLELPFNEQAYERLLEAGLDELLARHFAWLFTRDPLAIYRELLDQDNHMSSDHFENIQSTNWQTMRFKPPPAGSESIGWRVEFRPMEIQPTEFENAAFSVFVVLLTRIILAHHLNFYMPISLVDENMERAQRRDAARNQKFYFPCDPHLHESPIEELTINQILNGHENFDGILPLIERYLNSMSLERETEARLLEYLELIRMRAAGQLLTPATWIRRFVMSHPSYKNNSVVSEEITYDLVKEIDRIVHETPTPSWVNFSRHYSCA